MATQVASLFGVLSLDDKDFNRGVKDAGTKMENLASSMGGMVTNIGKVAAAGAVAVVGATTAIGAGMFELAKSAAPIEGIQKAFEGVAKASGQSSDKMLKALSEGSKGMITNTELMKSYNSAAQLVSTEFANQLPEAMQYLSKVSAATGQDMGFMLDSLVKGVGRVSPMILDNLGIQVNATEAAEEYAKAHGKAADQLTKTEQQAAIMAKTLELLKKNTAAMPDITDNASTKWAQFQTRLANFKDDVGVKLLPFFEQVLSFLMQLADQVLPIVMPVIERVAGAFTTFFDALSDGVNPIEAVAMAIYSVFGTSARPFVDFLKTMSDGLSSLIQGIGWFIADVQHAGIVEAIEAAFGVGGGFKGESWIEGVLVAFGMARETAHKLVTDIGGFFQSFVSFVNSSIVPAIQSLIQFIGGVVTGIQEFVQNNPAFITALGVIAVTVGVVMGVMAAAGVIFGVVTGAVGLLTGALGLLLSPAVLLVAAIAGIIYAADKLYPGGIAKLFLDAATAATQLGAILGIVLTPVINWIKQRFEEFSTTIANFIMLIDKIQTGINGIDTKFVPGLTVDSSHYGINGSGAGKRAGGGPVMAGGAYIVGEQGPELFTPSTSGNISTAQQTAGMMGGMHIGAVNVYANSYAEGQAAAAGFMDKARSMGYSFG